MIRNILSQASAAKRVLSDKRGNMIWYLLAAIGGIVIFYLIFFLLWGHIKGWFVNGS